MSVAHVNPDPLLTVEQAADYLGVSVRMIRRLVATRRAEFVKVGRHVRFRTSALDAYVQAGTVPAVQMGR